MSETFSEDGVFFNLPMNHKTPPPIVPPTRKLPRLPHKQQLTEMQMRELRSQSSDNESEDEWLMSVSRRYFATPQMITMALQLPQDGFWDTENLCTHASVTWINQEKMQRISRMLKHKVSVGFLNRDDFDYICQSVRIYLLASYEMELYLKEVELQIFSSNHENKK